MVMVIKICSISLKRHNILDVNATHFRHIYRVLTLWGCTVMVVRQEGDTAAATEGGTEAFTRLEQAMVASILHGNVGGKSWSD